MIALGILAFLLLLALAATQLKLRALNEAFGAERVRADAQRAQFERDTQALKRECDLATATASAQAGRWRSLQRAGADLLAAGGDDPWAAVCGLFAAAGHFRAISVRERDPELRSFAVRHAVGVSEEALARLRENRVPATVLREWADPNNALGPGYLLRARPSRDGAPPAPGAAMGQQDGWFVPVPDEAGEVVLYLSLAQPDPGRLPLAEELPLYEAAVAMVRALLARRAADSEGNLQTALRVRDSQLRTSSMEVFCRGLERLSESIRTGLGHVEAYAQSLADFGGDIPREEEKRLAGLIVDQARDMCEDALLVRDMAELTGQDGATAGPPAEFSGLYAESLQFLSQRAENRGVTLNGPPLQGGIRLDHPPGPLRRLLVLVSNELLESCSRGSEISVSAWLDQDHVNIHWRAAGGDVSPPGPPESNGPGWLVAQSLAQALGGTLIENTPGPDSRAVSLALPVAGTKSTEELRAA